MRSGPCQTTPPFHYLEYSPIDNSSRHAQKQPLLIPIERNVAPKETIDIKAARKGPLQQCFLNVGSEQAD